jgi:hypothetical protein
MTIIAIAKGMKTMIVLHAARYMRVQKNITEIKHIDLVNLFEVLRNIFVQYIEVNAANKDKREGCIVKSLSLLCSHMS